MDDSFELLSSMSPKISSKTKKNIKTKGLTKLALKKNIRHSSINRHAQSGAIDTSIILIEESLTDRSFTSCESENDTSIVNASVITISDTDISTLEVNVSRNKNDWISEVNKETKIAPEESLSNEKLIENINQSKIRMNDSNVISEASKGNYNLIQSVSNDKEIDYLSSNIENISLDTFEPKACSSKLFINNKNNLFEPEITSDEEDVIDGSEDSLNYENSKNFDNWKNGKSITLSRSEPRKTRPTSTVIINQPPKTEVKRKFQTHHKNPYMLGEQNYSNTPRNNNIQPAWVKRLQFLCDDDSSSAHSCDSPQTNLIKLKSQVKFNTDKPNEHKPSTILSKDLKNVDIKNSIKETKNTLLNEGVDTSKNKKVTKQLKIKLNFSSDDDSSDSETYDDLIKKLKNNVRISLPVSDESDKENFSDLSDNYESLEERIKKKIGKPKNEKIITSIPIVQEENLHKKIIKKKLDEISTKQNDVTKKNVKKTNKSKSTKISQEKCTPIKNKLDKNVCQSFLASLSFNIKDAECHPSARIFRNNYQTYKSQLAAKLFKLYNEKVFENSIPEDTPVEWSDRLRSTAGHCYCKKITRSTGVIERKVRIVLSNKILDCADRLRDTLIHELCHASTWIVNQVSNGHGSYWKEWTIKARNVFPELPPIKRCHSYVINTKYTYKCINCGYSFGRHSKSLNLEKKRCGYCYGKFEILLNKTNKNGETKSVPATPKKEATGFALFVKENYSLVRTPQMNHAQVMKQLGQKFNEMKVSAKD